MKLTILGAAGVRTPLVLNSIVTLREQIGLTALAFMDIEGDRLSLMHTLCEAMLGTVDPGIEVTWTQDARAAIRGADYVITTFRVGGMESRVIDEQVPLKYGVLGQETTGPGGFAMAMRTIPVMLDYVRLIREEAPDAWILNFTNPAGIVTEAVVHIGGYDRMVGICDNPAAMVHAAAQWIGTQPGNLLVEYFGLNHLGWMRSVYHQGRDRLPDIIDFIENHSEEHLPGLPFEPGFVRMLGMCPNEYNYFFTSTQQAIDHLTQAGQSRAQQIMPFNVELYETLEHLRADGAAADTMRTAYIDYLDKRHGTYMSIETGYKHTAPTSIDPLDVSAEGYSGVALGVIEALTGPLGRLSILNVPNRGAISGMDDQDVVEVTCMVGSGVIRPSSIGAVPDYALGLMKRVKAYERLTIEAATTKSYSCALEALAIHPLVPSLSTARSMLDDYCEQHRGYFPELS